MPATPPVRKATFRASGSELRLAAAAVRTLPRVASDMPMKPVSPDRNAPAMNARVRYRPDWAKLSASCPVAGLTTALEEMNTTTASGTRTTMIVRNWRLR